MNTGLIPLGDMLDFFNGKAPTTADDDEYIVFGSNGAQLDDPIHSTTKIRSF